MKGLIAISAASLLFLTGAANAISMDVQMGKHNTSTSVGIGDKNAGLSFNGNWTRSDHNGQLGSLGAAFGLPVGPFTASVGGKALYLSPKEGKDGAALAGGVGLSWAVIPSLSLYGEAYGAPSSLTSGVDSYTEAAGGARVTLIKPLTVDVGYRVIDIKGKNGNRSNKVSDGFYIGAGLSF
ncbi:MULTISPECIES: YfaZ family outer membrane protein [Xenorhabdus]|uniref:Porin n=1 Tax=Xenorhabdus miraniensis TaxID=351674 RepID=A0A2D0JUF1_9GAMM|nr:MULTISPECIES: YfaZ family outer membrane protein [Xenorhabdus]MBC8952321.1 porin [Xenorhabdus sp. PB62.4]PHM49946.1 porin [Xenorhabdus miraniensis]